MCELMRTALEGLVGALESAPATPVSVLNVLPEEERRQVIEGWNETETEFPGEKCIHELFEEQAEKSPDAVAVVFEEQQLTYGELNRRANQLGHYLREMGVGPDERVGICVERSLEMVIGLMAILKAGGAYVPLDPSYPSERLSYMLEDAQVPVLLTQRHLKGMFSGVSASIPMLDLSDEAPPWREKPERNVEGRLIGLTSKNLAYMIYTSGSTGTPKGVSIEHRQIVHYVDAVCERLKLRELKVFSLISTIAADLGNTPYDCLCWPKLIDQTYFRLDLLP